MDFGYLKYYGVDKVLYQLLQMFTDIVCFYVQ